MNAPEKVRIQKTAAVIVCCLIALGALVSAVWAWDTCSVTYIYPDGTSVSHRTLRGFSPLTAKLPDTEDGWQFVGWLDESGNLLPGGAVQPREDRVLTARVMPILGYGGHTAFLPPLENGMFCPAYAMTQSDGIRMLARLVDPDIRDEADAEQLLAGLGVTGAVTPDAPLTCGTLNRWVSAFYSPDEAPVFEMDGEAVLSRAQAAVLMDRVLGRDPAEERTAAQTGILTDVPTDHDWYGYLVEAAVDHTCVDGTWTESIPVPRQAEGLFTITSELYGTRMYCIGADGYLVKDGRWGNFLFDENGVYTSGMPELDELVQAVLAEITTEDMEPMEKLRAAYDYTVSSFTYLRRNYYDFRATGWGEQEAYTMLSTGYGNCYCYAATFYELARALGYDAILISGYIGTSRAPHGWVEFELDGEMYVCDPEIEMTYHRDRPYYVPDMFMMPYSMASAWSYVR